MTCEQVSGMRLQNSLLLLSLASAAWGQSNPWPQILSSIGVQPAMGNVLIAGPSTPVESSWRVKVESGAYLILEGESPLAASFGFHPLPSLVIVTCMIDLSRPDLPLVLEKPLAVHAFSVPASARVFSKDRWSTAPTMAGFKLGKGGVLWVIASPGQQGYERFPYLPQALVSLGFLPPVRAQRTWAFFDYSYRTRVDLDYFAARWKRAGISALHVASWHFYEADPERDAYLNRLIEACHREGILVYAWLELPHVSEKFWDDHPQWREKTAVLQDAQLDWRKLMNLSNPDCARTVRKGVSDLINRFDWDGVNLAELYFESLEGAANPSRFTPLNDGVRSSFRAERGFDPIDLWNSRRDPASLRLFLDFRTSLARHMQEEWLTEIEKSRTAHPSLDIVLTHVDDRMDRAMTDAIGADSERAFSLLKAHSFTFLVEDPATLWNLGPRRYPEIAKRYPVSPKLAIDINVVDRYQDVYPTKQQTGIELFELVHLAAESFPRVALYFENSILAPDIPLLSAASAVVSHFERMGVKLVVDSPRGFSADWSGPAMVDGVPWPAFDGREVILPAGRHVIEPTDSYNGPLLTDFNGDLHSATGAPKHLDLHYSSSSRALAAVNCEVSQLSVDGRPAEPHQVGSTLMLPSGDRRASIVCK
jgi:hypothetical protein